MQLRSVSNDVDASNGKNSASREGEHTPDDEPLSKDAQAGVQKMQATTSVWSKTHLITAYAL